jgi:hypothetical protein
MTNSHLSSDHYGYRNSPVTAGMSLQVKMVNLGHTAGLAAGETEGIDVPEGEVAHVFQVRPGVRAR